MIYIQLLFILSSVSVLNLKRTKHLTFILGYLFCAVFLLIFTYRSFSVPDTIPYYEVFKSPYLYKGYYEQGFLVLNDLLSCTSFRFFLFAITFISMLIWVYSSRKILNTYNVFVPLVCFMSFMGVFYWGIILRASIAMTILLFALSLDLSKRRNILVYIVLNCFAMLFHESTVVFFIVPFICDKEYTTNFLYSILIVSIVLFYINFVPLLSNYMNTFIDVFGMQRFRPYLIRETNLEESVFSWTLFKYIICSFTFIYFRSKVHLEKSQMRKYNLFLNIYLLGTVLYILVSYIFSGARLAMLFLYFEYILVSFIILHSIQRNLSKALFIFMLCTVNVLSLYSNVPLLFNYVDL